MLEIVVNRLSNMADRIPLMVSERLVDVTKSYIGQTVEAPGGSSAPTISMRRAITG